MAFKLQSPCNSSFSLIPISHNIITPSSSTPNKPHKLSFSLYSTIHSKDQILQGRVGFSVSAAKKRRSGNNVIEMDGYGEDEDEDEEADGVYIPFMGMTEWFQKKPSGFGEGKEYDTSVEDKLLEEIEQSRRAQAANINKLKNSPSLSSSKELKAASEVVPSGVRVRVGNLPKKRNIHRDLQLAFKGFPALVSISPAVTGNKKTRDPICKGFAFVYLGSEEAANRFVQTYSKRSITFGKTQKPISCEISNPENSSDPASRHSAKKNYRVTPEQRIPILVKDSHILAASSDSSLEMCDVVSSDESMSLDDQSDSAAWEDIKEDIQQVTPLEPKNDENMRPITVDIIDPPPPKQRQKTRTVKKKSSARGKSEKVPKSNIPGSTKRLKIKEKAVLANVFSKYGSKDSMAVTTSGS